MSPDQITVRLFRPDEWQLYKAIRLKALQSDPQFFGSNHAKEAAYPDTKWQEDLAKPRLGIFCVFRGDAPIGMTGIYTKEEDPSTAGLWGSWLEREWRGKGFSRQMYMARLEWAKSRPGIKKVFVAHRESNKASKGANQKHGFVFTHAEDHTWHDGSQEPQHFYELKI